MSQANHITYQSLSRQDMIPTVIDDGLIELVPLPSCKIYLVSAGLLECFGVFGWLPETPKYSSCKPAHKFHNRQYNIGSSSKFTKQSSDFAHNTNSNALPHALNRCSHFPS